MNQVEQLIDRWLEMSNAFSRHEFPGDPSMIVNRDYVLDYSVIARFPVKDVVGEREFVLIRVVVNDELNHAHLGGIFEDGDLVFAFDEVDTAWGEFLAGEKGITRKPEEDDGS